MTTTHTFDGSLTRAELIEDAPDGLYRVTDAGPRVVQTWYDVTKDLFVGPLEVLTIARVRHGGALPLTGECYERGDRQVIFQDVPVESL